MLKRLRIATICALLGGSIAFFIKSNLGAETNEVLELALTVFFITFIIFFIFTRK